MRPITYQQEHEVLVTEYDERSKHEQDPKYWEAKEVEPVRSATKAHYVEEQGYRCCYCQMVTRSGHGRLWDVEHIVSRSTHPQFMFEPENLASACVDCNGAKGAKNVLVNPRIRRYPRHSEAFIIVHPHYDVYDDHIAVACERFFIPKTKKGENTVLLCRLTRYAYEHVGWDSELADEPRLLQTLENMMTATDSGAKNDALRDLLMLAQIRVSRSLLG